MQKRFMPYGPWLRVRLDEFAPTYDGFAREMRLVAGVKVDRDGFWVVPRNAVEVFALGLHQWGVPLLSSYWMEEPTSPPTWEEVRAQLLAAGEVRPEYIDGFPAPHQRDGVCAFWRNSGHFWVGTGGGKTWMGIVAATSVPGPVLIVTRSAARLQVAREIERFTTAQAFVFRAQSSQRREVRVNGVTWQEYVKARMPVLRDIAAVSREWEQLKARLGTETRLVEQTLEGYLLGCATEGRRPWFVVGWEALLDHYDHPEGAPRTTRKLVDLGIQTVVLDESHLGKNGKNFDCVLLPPLHPDPEKAKEQRDAEKAEAYEQDGFIREDREFPGGPVSRKMFVPVDSRATAARRLGRAAAKRIGMTATPIFNRVADLAGQLSAVEPNCWGSTSAFHARYADAKPGRWGGMDVTGESNVDELRMRLKSITHIVPTHEAQKHMLHLKRRQSIYVSPEDQITELPGLAAEIKKARKEGGLSRLELERVLASSKKRGAVVSLLENHISANHKCVVFTARKRDCEDIGARIHKHRWGRLAEKPKVWVAHGDLSIEARDLIVQEYMAHPGPCVLVATGQSFGECIPPGTRLLTARGMVAIEDVAVGDSVAAGTGYHLCLQQTVKPHDGELYTVRGMGLLPFTTTANHRYLVAHGLSGDGRDRSIRLAEPAWQSADSLRPWVRDAKSGKAVGDWLLLPRYNGKTAQMVQTDATMRVDHDFAWLLGLHVADGWASEYRIEFGLNDTTKLKAAERAAEIWARLGVKTYTRRQGPHSLLLRADSCEYADLLREKCGHLSHNKRIPLEILFHADLSVLRSFIDGYLVGDGNVTPAGVVQSATVSEALALQLQLALARFGRLVKLSTSEPSIHRISGKRDIQGRHLVYHLRWRWTAGRYEHFKVLPEYIAVPIKSITTHPYQGPVYDIATSDQSFLGHGAIVHNSLNLDATDAAFFIQLPYTPGELRQWEGRFFRMSTKRPVVIYYVIAENTIDEQIASILLDKFPAVEEVAQDKELADASSFLAGIDSNMSDEEFARAVLSEIDWDLVAV